MQENCLLFNSTKHLDKLFSIIKSQTLTTTAALSTAAIQNKIQSVKYFIVQTGINHGYYPDFFHYKGSEKKNIFLRFH